MGLFDNREELKTMQIYIDRYAGVKEDMAKLENKIDQNAAQIKGIIVFNTLLLAILAIYIPITINLQSEKYDAKFETIKSQQKTIVRQLEELKQDFKVFKINKK